MDSLGDQLSTSQIQTVQEIRIGHYTNWRLECINIAVCEFSSAFVATQTWMGCYSVEPLLTLSVRAMERTLDSPGSIAEPMQELETDTEWYLRYEGIRFEGCRMYLRLTGCTWPIDVPQLDLWQLRYCSLSFLNRTCSRLLQHCIFCLALFLNERSNKQM